MVVGVDERAVDVQDRGRHRRRSRCAACAACLPSANSSTIFAQKAGRSSGLRELVEALVDVDLLVDPGRARVAQVGLQRRPRGERAALDHVGLDQRPRPVADHADRLGLLEERAHEADGVLVGAQEVGVRDAARAARARRSRRRRRLGDGLVDRERVGLVEVVERLDLAVLERDQLAACRRPARPPSTARSARPARRPRRRGTRSSCPSVHQPCAGLPTAGRSGSARVWDMSSPIVLVVIVGVVICSWSTGATTGQGRPARRQHLGDLRRATKARAVTARR